MFFFFFSENYILFFLSSEISNLLLLPKIKNINWKFVLNLLKKIKN